MHPIRRTTLYLFNATLLFVLSLNAYANEESKITMGGDVSLASEYNWQGFDYSDGGAVIQPEVYLSVGNFLGLIWFNYDIDTKKSDEFDYILEYDWVISDFSLGAGYAYYDYPQNLPHRDGWLSSQEVFFTLAYDNPINPYININYDFDEGEGAYYTTGLSRDIESSYGDFAVGGNLFYHDDYYDASGIPSVEISTRRL